jgi:hypothetical protein
VITDGWSNLGLPRNCTCTAAIKKYYLGKMALELLCTIYGLNIISDKITVIARILSIKISPVIGWILPWDKRHVTAKLFPWECLAEIARFFPQVKVWLLLLLCSSFVR